MFDPKTVVFALITYYPEWYKGKLKDISHIDKVRGDLALKFIQKASSLKYNVVIAENFSSKSFRRRLHGFKRITVIKRRSNKRSPAKRQVFQKASKIPGVKVIIATEPEKISLINFIKDIAMPILENKADIVIPKREKKLFRRTYPDYMYESEIKANKIYNRKLKEQNILHKESRNLDWFFGPRVFKNDPKILSLFFKILPVKFQSSSENNHLDEYSNTMFFPIVNALKKKYRVKSIEISFLYPQLQNKNESIGVREFFIQKRETQRIICLKELMNFLKFLKSKATCPLYNKELNIIKY